MTFRIFCSLVSHVGYRYVSYFFVEANQQALKRKDSDVHCGSIGKRNNGIISSRNSQCLVNLVLMRHSLMAVDFGSGDLG